MGKCLKHQGVKTLLIQCVIDHSGHLELAHLNNILNLVFNQRLKKLDVIQGKMYEELKSRKLMCELIFLSLL